MPRILVDPPSGWQYGFPAYWDTEKFPSLIDFLRYKRYPEKLITLGHVRYIFDDPVDEGPCDEMLPTSAPKLASNRPTK